MFKSFGFCQRQQLCEGDTVTIRLWLESTEDDNMNCVASGARIHPMHESQDGHSSNYNEGMIFSLHILLLCTIMLMIHSAVGHFWIKFLLIMLAHTLWFWILLWKSYNVDCLTFEKIEIILETPEKEGKKKKRGNGFYNIILSWIKKCQILRLNLW